MVGVKNFMYSTCTFSFPYATRYNINDKGNQHLVGHYGNGDWTTDGYDDTIVYNGGFTKPPSFRDPPIIGKLISMTSHDTQ